MPFSLRPTLIEVHNRNGSDLHLCANTAPMGRIVGELMALSSERVTEEEMLSTLKEIASPSLVNTFKERGEVDFRYEIPGFCNYRVNYYRTLKGTAAEFREIPGTIPTMQALGIPPSLSRLGMLSNGLVLVTGATGSGKSTTTAAIVDYANQMRRDHILTIEDPIEFIYDNKSCLVSQREVGLHTPSFPSALRMALREDPDIIVIGEMRDRETMQLAMEAAETGHLVFATLHTRTAAQTVDRIISIFPEGDKPQVRAVLADTLKAVLSVALMKKADGKERLQAMEIMMVNSAIRNLIREGKTHLIPNVIQTSRAQGMRTMDDCLNDFYNRGLISREMIEKHALNLDIALGNHLDI